MLRPEQLVVRLRWKVAGHIGELHLSLWHRYERRDQEQGYQGHELTSAIAHDMFTSVRVSFVSHCFTACEVDTCRIAFANVPRRSVRKEAVPGSENCIARRGEHL